MRHGGRLWFHFRHILIETNKLKERKKKRNTIVRRTKCCWTKLVKTEQKRLRFNQRAIIVAIFDDMRPILIAAQNCAVTDDNHQTFGTGEQHIETLQKWQKRMDIEREFVSMHRRFIALLTLALSRKPMFRMPERTVDTMMIGLSCPWNISTEPIWMSVHFSWWHFFVSFSHCLRYGEMMPTSLWRIFRSITLPSNNLCRYEMTKSISVTLKRLRENIAKTFNFGSMCGTKSLHLCYLVSLGSFTARPFTEWKMIGNSGARKMLAFKNQSVLAENGRDQTNSHSHEIENCGLIKITFAGVHLQDIVIEQFIGCTENRFVWAIISDQLRHIFGIE